MNRYPWRRLPAILLLCTIAAAGTAQVHDGDATASVDAVRFALYDYDSVLPLNPELKPLADKTAAQTALRQRFWLAYDSVHDQRVTAILTIPQRFPPPHPAVILLAGSGGHKDTDYLRIAADLMSTLGFATLSLDAQYHGERSRPGRSGDIHLIYSDTMRDGWIQTVIDLRRAVDYLQSRPDVDRAKIGYLGFSQGGMIGGTFIGVEPRIAAACLAIPGGGLSEWGRKAGLVAAVCQVVPGLTPMWARQAGAWNLSSARMAEINASLTDPIHFIGRYASRPLLVLAAKKDEIIPRFATMALYDAAREPKQINWYNAGHTLLSAPNALLVDTRAFFIKHLGSLPAQVQSVNQPCDEAEAAGQSLLGSRAGEEREIGGVRLCWCPPGRFRMGSPPGEPERRPDETQVDVTLTRGFWMGKFEVTQGQWKRVAGSLPGPLTAELPAGDDLPIGNVNYAEAEAFCRKLTELGRKSGDLPAGWEFRLPTEAQWEYACRAGTRTATSFGDKLCSKQANFQGRPYNGAENGPSLNRAVKVGSYPANAWGLHDMHGNTFEWCRDWYHQRLPGGVDPDLSSVRGDRNRDGTFYRVRRGGAWCDDGWPCRSAARLRFEPERRYDHIGFRVAVVQR